MRILLSNDDGVLAPGLAALRAAVADLGDVTVVAPDDVQSASGHSITIRHPLCVRRIEVDAPQRFQAISVDGRPADCVSLAIRSLMDARPDLVISGINAGANVGINVFYSGTVAAAAEGAMLGVPSVAFSASMTGHVDFPRVARLCRWVLGQLLEGGLAPGDLLNVNIPALGQDGPRGVRVVRQSTVGMESSYSRVLDESGRELYRMGEAYAFQTGRVDTDVVSLAEGYITVTPLHVDMTNHDRLATMETVNWRQAPP